MAIVVDMKTVLETLVGHSIQQNKLIKLVNIFYRADPHSVIENGVIEPADPASPTMAEKAEMLRLSMLQYLKDAVHRGADKDADAEIVALRKARKDAALGDLS